MMAQQYSHDMDVNGTERFGKNWSMEEERTLLEGYRHNGPNWDLIQSLLPQRKGIVSKWKRLVATGNMEAIELQKYWRHQRDRATEEANAVAANDAQDSAALGLEHGEHSPGEGGSSSVGGGGLAPPSKRRRGDPTDSTQLGASGGPSAPYDGGLPSSLSMSMGLGLGPLNVSQGLAFGAAPNSTTHAALQARRDMGQPSHGEMGHHATNAGTSPPLTMMHGSLGVGGMGMGVSLGSHGQLSGRRNADGDKMSLSHGLDRGSALATSGEGLGMGTDFGQGYMTGGNASPRAPAGKKGPAGSASSQSLFRAPLGQPNDLTSMMSGGGHSGGMPVRATVGRDMALDMEERAVTLMIQVPVPILDLRLFPDPSHAEDWITQYARSYAEHFAHAYARAHGEAHMRAYSDYAALPHVQAGMAARQAARETMSVRSEPGMDGMGGLLQGSHSSHSHAQAQMPSVSVRTHSYSQGGGGLIHTGLPDPISLPGDGSSMARGSHVSRMHGEGLASLMEAVEESEPTGGALALNNEEEQGMGGSPAKVRQQNVAALLGLMPVSSVLSPADGPPHTQHVHMHGHGGRVDEGRRPGGVQSHSEGSDETSTLATVPGQNGHGKGYGYGGGHPASDGASTISAPASASHGSSSSSQMAQEVLGGMAAI